MGRILISATARHDLADIACYIAADDVLAAERWLDSVDRVLRLVSENPELGESVHHLKIGLRRHVHGRYVLFYMPQSDGILLYRVLHGARKMEDLLD